MEQFEKLPKPPNGELFYAPRHGRVFLLSKNVFELHRQVMIFPQCVQVVGTPPSDYEINKMQDEAREHYIDNTLRNIAIGFGITLENEKDPLENQVRQIVEETVKVMNKNNSQTEYGESNTVFVSHSFHDDDKKLAVVLKDKLKESDIDAYLAEKEKRYGYIISGKIKEAIRNCYCVIVILTKNSVISASVNQELGYAMGINRDIIPMVKDDVRDKVGVLLKDIEGEEFTDQDFEDKCRIIVNHILKMQKESIQSEVMSESTESFRKERGSF